MPISWYFKKDGLEHGPVTSDDIRMLAKLGMILPTDLVRKADMERWAPASALKGLFPKTSPSAPVISPVAAAQISSAFRTPPPQSAPRASRLGFYLTGLAALAVLAAGLYRFVVMPGLPSQAHPVSSSEQSIWQPTTQPILASETIDPLLTELKSDNVLDRGIALQQVRAATVSIKIRPQVHQIICDTVQNRAFSSIWPSAARALGEIGSADDLTILKPLIDGAPVETQCAAMATAMVLDPKAGLSFFEPHASDQEYGGATTGYLVDLGSRSESAALLMLKSSQRMCRYHALYVLSSIGSPKSVERIAAAMNAEPDKAIARGYQGTIDAINKRIQQSQISHD